MAKRTRKTTNFSDDTFMGILSYVNILCLVPLVLRRDDSFIQFHAKQGLALFIIEVFAFLISWTVILAWLSTIIFFFCFLASLYGISLVAQKKKTAIPGLDYIIKKFNL
ncbi:MAG: hypothetical protein HYV32_01095 [Candidatus Kerfeldbacteria bacterium]|nr:hypothetical protein [Candidatus Kerfeldbacteria bacterium]